MKNLMMESGVLLRSAFFVIALAAIGCQKKEEPKESSEVKQDSIEAEKPPVSLTLKWETDTVLTTSESVLYDKDREVLYVANINGAPDGKDGNGFIAKVSLDGKVTEAQWVKGLNAPKGLGLYQDKLYVADIDQLVEIDVKQGKVTKRYPAKGAQFLNDVTIDSAGKVFVSDTGTGEVLALENGKLNKWIDKVDGANGLLAEGDRMLLLSFSAKTLSTIDPSSKQVTKVSDNIENADGIEALGDGNYLASSWNGIVHYVGSDFKAITVLDLRQDSINAADIEYIQDKNLLLVPTFFKNTVRAYEVSK